MMDSRTKAIVRKIAIDVCLLASVALPILFAKLFGQPYRRGFFCNDESIRYPFKDSTVPSLALYFVGLGLPIASMLYLEIYIAKKTAPNAAPLFLFGRKVPVWLINCYKAIGVFCFGAACSQLVTDVGKYSIGRLRPNFFSVCEPNIDCSLAQYKYKYIETYECLGHMTKWQREARLSFPSGHSSFSSYCMIYLVLYLQARINWKGSYLMKHVLQICCILITWGIALSRITDNKHHWSDVTVGLIIGISSAFITAFGVSNLFKKGRLQHCIDEKTALASSSRQTMIDKKDDSSSRPVTLCNLKLTSLWETDKSRPRTGYTRLPV